MPTTPRGIPYPASTDAPRVWEDLQELADGVDSALGALSGSDITSGTIAPARLGSGTTNSTTFLRGDGSWQIPPSSGGTGALAVKPLLTTRVSTTTLTADPHLSVNLAASATYLVNFACPILLGSGTTLQTISYDWVAAGASQSGSGWGVRVGSTSAGGQTSGLGGMFFATTSSTSPTLWVETLYVTTTSATTLALHWAQSVASATALVLDVGASVSAVRIA